MNKFFTLLFAIPFVASAQTNDPASCYNPNSAVYDCTMVGVADGYDDGYTDGYNAAIDSLQCDFSYYINTIGYLDSALTIYVNLYNESQEELAIVEDEVMYWMEAYNDAVTECNDYVEDLLDNYEYTEAFADSLQTQLDDCADAVQWNFDLLQDCRERLADCDGYDIYTGLPALEATYDVYGAPVDVRNYTGVVIYVFSNGTSVRGMNVAQ